MFDIITERKSIFSRCILLLLCLAVFIPVNVSGRERNQKSPLSINDWVTGLAYSPDGKILAVGGLLKSKVYLLDTQTWRVIRILEHPHSGGREISFSPSGKVLASVADDLDEVAIYFWDVVTGRRLSTFSEHELITSFGARRGISAIAFAPNGKILAVGLNDGIVRLLDVENPSAVRTLKERFVAFDTGISSLKFSPDSSLIAVSTGKGVSGPNDWGILKVLETQTGREVASFSKLSAVYDSSYSQDGTLLAIAVNRGAVLIDTTSWKILNTLGSFPVSNLAFSSGAKMLASASYHGKVEIWNIRNASVIQSINQKSISALTISPDDKFIAIGDEGGHVRIYSMKQAL